MSAALFGLLSLPLYLLMLWPLVVASRRVLGVRIRTVRALIGAATGLMAVMLLASTGGPAVGPELTLNQLFGYNLPVVSALLGLRLLFVVFRSQRGIAGKVDGVA
jgi:ubiquinone biosynthesis protein